MAKQNSNQHSKCETKSSETLKIAQVTKFNTFSWLTVYLTFKYKIAWGRLDIGCNLGDLRPFERKGRFTYG
jgi:hypothetical protein